MLLSALLACFGPDETSGASEPLPEVSPPGTGAETFGVEPSTLSVPTPWGSVSAELTPKAGGAGESISARCECTFEYAALGGKLTLSISAEGTLTGNTFEGTVSTGRVQAQVSATLGGSGLAKGTFSLPLTPIADVYAVLADLAPEAHRAEMRGKVSAKGDFGLFPLVFHVEPAVEAFAVDGLVGAEYRIGAIEFTGRDEAKQPILIRSGEGSPGWMSLAEFGPMLPMAVVSAEDAGFYRHAGFDISGIKAAATDNERLGKIARGGSTLSQQLAKNLFLTPERTYARKIRELLYAVEMERELGKDRILELYLNVVEWGPNVRGGKAASEAYFLKQPAGLLPEEAAFLSSILRNPRGGWEKQYVGGRVQTSRLKWILDNMRGLSPEDRAAALGREVHFVPPVSP